MKGLASVPWGELSIHFTVNHKPNKLLHWLDIQGVVVADQEARWPCLMKSVSFWAFDPFQERTLLRGAVESQPLLCTANTKPRSLAVKASSRTGRVVAVHLPFFFLTLIISRDLSELNHTAFFLMNFFSLNCKSFLSKQTLSPQTP